MDRGSFWAGVTGDLWPRVLLASLIAVVAALLVSFVVGLVVRAVARRRGWPDRAVVRLRRPFRVLLIAVALLIAFTAATGDADARSLVARVAVRDVLLVAIVGSAAWLAASLVSLVVDLLLIRYRTDVADNRVARRVRTQALIIRRVAVALIVLVAVAVAILLVFPEAQALGASLLASAGVVSIIAGLAAQSTLGNVIAGMQIAFSDAIRIDDVVVVDGEWGRIEEITLTYVVLHVWDDRRLVLPSTYFTTTPFENWTRTSSQLMQPVDFDLDWRLDPDAMRDELHRILGRTQLWDGRTSVLQVTDAVGGLVHVRVLVTAVDAPTLFDLRCYVREELVRFLRERQPQALPQTRVLLAPEEAAGPTPVPARTSGEQADRELFGGSAAGRARGRDFTGPVPTGERRD